MILHTRLIFNFYSYVCFYFNNALLCVLMKTINNLKLGAPWSRGRALSRRPGGPGSNLAYSSIFRGNELIAIDSIYRGKRKRSKEEEIGEV